MKIKDIALVCICIIIGDPSISAQDQANGWASTQWGMSKDQVLETIRALSQKGGIDPISADLKDGIFPVAKTKLGSYNYYVSFIFDGNTEGLDEVKIKFAGDSSHLIGYHEVEALLTKKYGRFTYTYDDRNDGWRTSRSKTTIWKLDGMVIEMQFLYIQDISIDVMIFYKSEARVTDETILL
jgi:hypothetical protein